MDPNQIVKAWSAIEKWFAANASSDEFALSAGASESELRRVESAIGLRFPDDLRISYAIHDGVVNQRSLYFSYYLLTLEEIIKTCNMLKQILEQGNYHGFVASPKGPIRPVYWDPCWIQFMDNGAGDGLAVDMNPAEGGAIGQVIVCSHETGPERVLAISFGDWLSQFADDLRNGKYEYDGDVLPVDFQDGMELK